MTIFSLQGYYSILIYIFIDLSVNFMRMTVGSALDYICFTCIRCNGTTLIAEIHRLMINDVDLYVSKIREHDSLYEFLYSMAVDLALGMYDVNSVFFCIKKSRLNTCRLLTSS